MSAGSLTVGVGFTVSPIVWAMPLHVSPALANCGVTVTMAFTGLDVELLVMNAPIVPDPLALNPMEGAEFTHV